MSRRSQSIVRAVARELESGPVPMREMLVRLERHGLRYVDVTELWTAVCVEHKIADLDGDDLVPLAWRAQAGTGERPPATTQAVTPEVPVIVQHELQGLRNRLQLTSPTPATPVPTSTEWKRCADQIQLALKEENAEAVRQKISQAHALEDGELIAEQSGRRVVRYQLVSDGQISEGSRATLTADDVSFDVDVLSVIGLAVTLAGRGIPASSRASLSVDMTWLLRRQLTRVVELRDFTANFNSDFALLCAGEHEAEPRVLESMDLDGLNPRQNEGVAQSVEPGLTWLWGPPGTGKTTTIAAIVEELLLRGDRVLLVAPTNVAVDVALVATLKRYGPSSQHRMVRVGHSTHPDLVGRAPGVMVDQVAAERGVEVAARLSRVLDKLRELRSALRESKDVEGRRAIESQLDLLTQERNALESLMGEVRVSVCLEADLVAATAHQVVLDTLRTLMFDSVVLDEASMTTAALAALVAGKARERLVIAGDFRQLPPVVQASSHAARDWLQRSPFERAGISERVATGDWPHNLVALTDQHRMDEPISELVSDVFYSDSGLAVAETVRRRPPVPLPPSLGDALVLVDTSDLAAVTQRRQGMFSRLNVAHAQLGASLLALHTGSEVGLISPYAAQARLLESLVPEHESAKIASTVHRFQGAERDVIVFDTVETGRGVRKIHDWFAGSLEDVGPRLINVAVSRARRQVVVMGDLAALRAQASGIPATFQRMMTTRSHHASWEELVTRPGSPTWLVPASEVLDCLEDDLAHARQVEARIDPVDMPFLLPVLSARDVQARLVAVDSATIWSEAVNGDFPRDLVTARALTGVFRLATPVRGTVITTDAAVWTLTRTNRSLVTLRTAHGDFAAATGRMLRRDVTGDHAAAGQRCGRCGQRLVRDEHDRTHRTRCGSPRCPTRAFEGRSRW